MPRSRNVKHSFFTNDSLADNDPLGRLLFIGLWTIADFKGDLVWRPRRIKAELLPYDNCDIDALAINLDQSGFIRMYSVQDQIYVNITNFGKHQNPHKNERDRGSDIPPFTDEARQAIDIKRITINRDKSRQDHDKNGIDPADSCILIPDPCYLNPDTQSTDSMSGKPDVVIEYLNSVTGKKFKLVAANIKLIKARLDEGHTIDDIKSVIDRQNLVWPPGNPGRMYMRPATLFNATKFNQYVGEIGQPVTEQSNGQPRQDRDQRIIDRLNHTRDYARATDF